MAANLTKPWCQSLGQAPLDTAGLGTPFQRLVPTKGTSEETDERLEKVSSEERLKQWGLRWGKTQVSKILSGLETEAPILTAQGQGLASEMERGHSKPSKGNASAHKARLAGGTLFHRVVRRPRAVPIVKMHRRFLWHTGTA